MLLARTPQAFHSRTLRESAGGEEAGGVERQPGARSGGEGAEGENKKWAEDKRFEGEGGAEMLQKQRGSQIKQLRYTS